MRHIFGNGISAYIIASVLHYKGLPFIIHGKGEYKPQPLLYLEVKNRSECIEYFKIFNIEFNYDKYVKHIKVGFSDIDGNILDKPTEKMKNDYLLKQERVMVSSSMSDRHEEYDAIDLSLIIPILVKRFKEYVIEEDCTNYKYNKNDIIYNTIIPTKCNNNVGTFEYILKASSVEFSDYDYVYDCSPHSSVKRYTKHFIEYLTNVRDARTMIITNYYASPEIYKTYDVKGDYTIVDISRNATKTQLKQRDIIEYMLKHG